MYSLQAGSVHRPRMPVGVVLDQKWGSGGGAPGFFLGYKTPIYKYIKIDFKPFMPILMIFSEMRHGSRISQCYYVYNMYSFKTGYLKLEGRYMEGAAAAGNLELRLLLRLLV